jgi:hypothetical protein
MGATDLLKEEWNDGGPTPVDRGAGFLFWGWIVVALLNLGMVTVALALFAP